MRLTQASNNDQLPKGSSNRNIMKPWERVWCISNMITIYKITNPVGKVYIGQTKNLRLRLNLYRKLCCKPQRKLYNSLKKYGFNNHIIDIIEEVNINSADEREIYWIKYFQCYHYDINRGLNLNRGGNRPKHTQETKKRISEAILGSKNIKAKKLYQYTLDKTLIKEWACMKDIERELGYFTTMLSFAAKGNGKAYGYLWSYSPL